MILFWIPNIHILYANYSGTYDHAKHTWKTQYHLHQRNWKHLAVGSWAEPTTRGGCSAEECQSAEDGWWCETREQSLRAIRQERHGALTINIVITDFLGVGMGGEGGLCWAGFSISKNEPLLQSKCITLCVQRFTPLQVVVKIAWVVVREGWAVRWVVEPEVVCVWLWFVQCITTSP